MDAVQESSARRLPRGSHGIPADVVRRNQRERLIAAMAEQCAEVGYTDATVAAVARCAGVSSLTFYKQFSDKRDCMLAAHKELLTRLLEDVDRARVAANTTVEKLDATVRTTLDLFAADPPSAQLLTIEILAAGPEGSKRHDAMVAAFAERLGTGWVPAAGMLMLVGTLAVAGEADRIPELESDRRLCGRLRRVDDPR